MLHSHLAWSKFCGQLLCLLLLIGLGAGVRAGEFTLAPLNPDFVAATGGRGLAGMRSADGATCNYGYLPSPVDFSYLKELKPAVRDVGPLPARFDLRELHGVTSVKNQSPAGTCWAFASLGSLESCLMPGEEWDFSENNVKDLCGYDGDPNNGGGNQYMVLATLARWTGPVAEADDPYNGSNTGSPQNKPAQKHLQDAAIIPQRMGPRDNDALKAAIMRYGAVAVTMNFDDAAFNPHTNAYYYTGGGNNHLIALVGWDDNYDKANFNSEPPDNGAFIAKNSWGSSWGDGGYFYISYFDHRTGYIDNVAFYNAESPDNYANIYQYDTYGLTGRVGDASPQTYFANVFTAQRNEFVSAVSWYNLVPNVPYTVFIYTDPNGAPSTGTLAYYLDGVMEDVGYHTVKLGKAIPILQGHKFAVVVRIEAPDVDQPIPVEGKQPHYSSRASANTGESYISADGVQWLDLAAAMSNTNVCLKAFTLNTTQRVATPRFTPLPQTGLKQYYQVVSLVCDTQGATIRYTTNGSEPTATSTAYAAPITLLDTTTIKAKAFKDGLQESVTNTATYTIPPAPKAEGVIVFTSTRDGHPQIYSMDAKDGSKQTRLTNSPGNDDHACISRDSRYITFQSDRDGHTHIYRMDADGGNVAQLTSGDYDDKYPSFRYDGFRIVFTSNRDGHDELYVMHSDGTQQTRLTTMSTGSASVGRYSLCWNSHRITFLWQTILGAQICSINEDGSSFQSLTALYSDNAPLYDNAQQHILFNSNRNGVKQNIYRMDADGSNVTALTAKTTSNELAPYYNPNCDIIAFCSDRNSTGGNSSYDIYQMYADGTGEKRLTSNQGSNTWPSWGPVPRSQPDRCTFDPAPGTYTGSVRVTITGDIYHFLYVDIYYTTDGSEPAWNGPTSHRYTGPLLLTSTTTLKAKGSVDQFPDSYVSTAKYTVLQPVDAPVISPDDGPTFMDVVPISMSCPTIGATIRYTTNGNDPTSQSTAYRGPFNLTGSCMLRAKAFKTGMAPSRVAVMKYAVRLSAPTIAPDPGTYGNSVMVRMACAATGATIHYTTNGSEPTATSPQYKNPLTLTVSTTVKAAAFKADARTSPTVSAHYEIDAMPTAGKIAFTSTRDGNAEIYIMDPDGSDQKRLTNTPAADDMPCLSADGSKIAFTTNRDVDYHIYVMGADGKTPKRLTSTKADDTLPAFNLQGTKICFTSNRDGHHEIYVMNADGSGQTRLTNSATGESACGRFSPDGTKIVFASNRKGSWQIYTMNPNGLNVVQLTASTGDDTIPSFSPDGEQILFQSTRSGNSKLYLMDADGGNVHIVTDKLPGNESGACFSPDGSLIAYSSDRNGKKDLYAVSLAGTNEVRLTQATGENTNPSWAGALALTPTFSPAPGNYSKPVAVTIKCATKNAVIYYTTDGSEPSPRSAKYSTPVAITGTTMLKAKAVVVAMTPSITAVGTYTFPQPAYVPDLLIRTDGETDFTGGGIYNQDGTNQGKGQSVLPGKSATYYLRIQNNSTAPDAFTVTASPFGSNWTMVFTDAGSGQPVAIAGAGGWTTPALNAGQYLDVKMVATAGAMVAGGASCPLLLSAVSTHDANKRDAVLAVTSVPVVNQPDMQVRAGGTGDYLGNGTYNTDGTTQTVTQSVARYSSVRFDFYVENDGTLADNIVLEASAGNPGWTLQYYDGATDMEMTADLTNSNGISQFLAPGNGRYLYAVASPGDQVPAGDSQIILFSATSVNDPTKSDVVKAVANATEPYTYQPDLWVKATVGQYVGQNLYSTDGSNQTAPLAVAIGTSYLFTFHLVNNGTGADSFKVTAPFGNNTWEILYTRADTGQGIRYDITSQAGWTTPSLAPGESIDITAVVTPLTGAVGYYPITVQATSNSDTSKVDTVMGMPAVNVSPM